MAIGKAGSGAGAKQPPRKKYTLDDLLISSKDFDAKDSTNVMLIGVPNSKKTFSLNTIPNEWKDWKTGETRPFDVIYINADDRASVIDWDRRPHWRVVNLPLGGMNPKEIIDMHQDLIEGLSKLEKKPDCIIYDSLSVVSKNIDNFAWGNVDGKGYSHGYEGNEDRFGYVTYMLELIIFGLQRNCQFFFAIAHEKEPYWAELKENASKAKYKPDLIGGIKNILPRFFHEVYFTYKHNGDWHWLTQTMGQREPRTCYPVERFLPPDWSIIINRKWKEYEDVEAAIDVEQAEAEAARKEQQQMERAMKKGQAAETKKGGSK